MHGAICVHYNYSLICICPIGQPEKSLKTHNPSKGRWNLTHVHAKTLKATTLLTIHAGGVCLAMLLFLAETSHNSDNQLSSVTSKLSRNMCCITGCRAVPCDDISKHRFAATNWDQQEQRRTDYENSCGLKSSVLRREICWFKKAGTI